MKDSLDTTRPPAGTDIAAFLAACPAGALLGLDVGTKTIGVAASDAGRRIATPLALIRRAKFAADAAELLRLATGRAVTGIVLGLPLNMDGTQGPRVQSTRAFARNLVRLAPLPMLLWDERLSTAAVTRTLIEADRSRARRAQLVDKMAAAYILQGVLDRAAGMAREPRPVPAAFPRAEETHGRDVMPGQDSSIGSSTSVTLAAPPDRVWRAITDPAQIRDWFFGVDTIADWKVGGRLVHRGQMNGEAYEDKGEILALDPGRSFTHSHWSPLSGRPDEPENYERVTYTLRPAGGDTELTISEENLPGPRAKATSEKAWAGALAALKKLVEQP
jgi:putative Holliday junction resolvase